MNCITWIVKKQLLFFYKTTVQSQLPKCFAFCQYGVSAKYNFINCLKNANILCQLYEIVLGSEQLYIFNLPINRCYTMLLQKPVCLTEWFAAEKSSVSRKRAWMRCFQYQMMRIVQHGFLLLCRTPPEINTIGLSCWFNILIAASVNCSQPIPLWEFAWWARTVKTVFKSSTPCFAHFSR